MATSYTKQHGSVIILVLLGTICLIGIVALFAFRQTKVGTQTIINDTDKTTHATSTISPLIPTTIEDLLTGKPTLLGKNISVSGKLTFYQICSSSAQSGKNSCFATAYLVAPEITDLQAYTINQGILLYENNHRVGCQAQTTKPQTCNDWIAGKRYNVQGLFDYEQVNGKKLNQLTLIVENKQEE